MFNLFKKKGPVTKITDIVWINTTAKWNGLAAIWQIDNNSVFIFWFDDSLRECEQFLQQREISGIELATVREFSHSSFLNGKTAVFAEHYPLSVKEQEIFQSLNLESVTVLSALDEPLFKKFGADKIIDLLEKLGMDKNESIQHGMISSAIRNAQEKIQSKITIDQSAQSQADWFQKNLPAENN